MHLHFKGIGGLSLAACIVSSFAADRAQSQQPVNEALSFRPFIAQRTERVFSEGKLRDVISFSFARRSDGSHVATFTTHAPDGTPGIVTEIADFRAGRSVTLEPFTKSAMTLYESAAQIHRQKEVEKKCADAGFAANAPHATLLGYDTVRVVQDGRADQSEMWVAPLLDCYALSSLNVSPSLGSRNESVVTSIIEGEPPESMFQVPSDYVERSPFQVEAAFMGRFHSSYLGETVNEMERRYNAARR